MGLFDKAKEVYKQQQDKTAELKNTRGDKLATLSTEYMGGYNDKKKTTGNLTFYANQVEFKVALKSGASFTIPTTDIKDIAIEGKDEVSRRVTVTRLFAVGIFAFALKKKSKDKDAFITVELNDGQEAVFHIKDKSPMELKAKLSKAVAQIKQNTQKPTDAAGSTSAADELAKLATLKKRGIITQDEFDKKKTELLA